MSVLRSLTAAAIPSDMPDLRALAAPTVSNGPQATPSRSPVGAHQATRAVPGLSPTDYRATAPYVAAGADWRARIRGHPEKE